MKKSLAFILLVSYLVVSSGVVVNYHYCMNRLASTELFSTESNRCGKCGMDMHKGKGCCHDEVKVVKMNSDQKLTVAVSYQLPSFDAVITDPSVFINTSFCNAPTIDDYQNHSPPLLTEQDTYVRNRVFRI